MGACAAGAATGVWPSAAGLRAEAAASNGRRAEKSRRFMVSSHLFVFRGIHCCAIHAIPAILWPVSVRFRNQPKLPQDSRGLRFQVIHILRSELFSITQIEQPVVRCCSAGELV